MRWYKNVLKNHNLLVVDISLWEMPLNNSLKLLKSYLKLIDDIFTLVSFKNFIVKHHGY